MNGQQQADVVTCCVDVVICVRDDVAREAAPSPALSWRAVDGEAFAIGWDESQRQRIGIAHALALEPALLTMHGTFIARV
ncbi:unnamed protein product [Mycetohabitans rhizoxinica HKI 454]|uniref:Uncharacterized protein n=1 Tax=Mycetohabitans rhizoxinica (strain DSM 19002 / CIP 109453 / HKI 454) TaxID=882378 RepID=E5AS34_MYCRK|nr:unnamed protein product [Mycetohabitans rhizoxinica HKI 454]